MIKILVIIPTTEKDLTNCLIVKSVSLAFDDEGVPVFHICFLALIGGLHWIKPHLLNIRPVNFS